MTNYNDIYGFLNDFDNDIKKNYKKTNRTLSDIISNNNLYTDIIKSKKYNNTNEIGSLFNQIKPIIPIALSSDYEKMKEIAAKEDDFKLVIDHFISSVERSQGIDINGAKKALIESHEIYIDTQKQCARFFGNQGLFDLAEENLKNAHLCCEITLGHYGKITLEPKIDDSDIEQITNDAIQNTSPKYFLKRVMIASNEGDIEKFEKYSALSLRSLEEKGIIQIPNKEETKVNNPPSGQKYERFIKLRMKFTKLHKKTYELAITAKIKEAIAYAIKNDNYPYADKVKINNLQEETKDLMLNYTKKNSHTSEMSDNLGATITFFNKFINPIYDELLACRKDKNHPLKTIYEPKRENGCSYGKIVGSKRTQVQTTSIVPQNFYEEMFLRTGIPITVHSFFNHVVEMYKTQ